MLTKRIKRKKELMEVDITSLLDILVILLFFLLQSYNTSEVKMKVPEKLSIAQSLSKSNASKTTVLQVTRDKKVFINNIEIGSIKQRTKIIQSLKSSKLASEKEKNIKDKDINLVFDENLSYSVIKKIMKTATSAGFSNFHLIVQGGS